MEDTTNDSDRPTKRKRLNYACNHCRAKKVRCDQQEPSCRGCLAASVPCVTTDKRRPGFEVRRRPAGEPGPSPRLGSSSSSGGGARRPVEILPAGSPLVMASSGPAAVAGFPTPRGRKDSSGGMVPLTPASGSSANRRLSMATATAEQPDATAARTTTTAPDPLPNRFAGRLPMLAAGRRGNNGGRDAVEITTGWLELAFHRLGLPSSHFDECLRRNAAEHKFSSPPVPPALPRIPPAARCRALLARYYATAHVLFPIVEREVLDGICEEVVSSCAAGMVHAGRLPELLLFCLAAVLGCAAAGENETDNELIDSYVGFCEAMLGTVLGWGTVDAVRVVCLLALALRWREKITSAWPLAGVCVTMAQVLGLNRRRRQHGRRSGSEVVVGSGEEEEQVEDPAEQDRRCVWWCVYSFEKLFAFELGRPSAIVDADHDQLEPARRGVRRGEDDVDADFFHIAIGLARTLSEVSQRSIAARTKEELAGREGLENAIRFKVATTGKLVLLLMQWADSLPKHLRPTSDLICEPGQFPLASFISAQYHSAMIMLLRNTLLVSDEAMRRAFEEHAAGTPWDLVTRNGQAIAANSARSIVRMLMEGHDLEARPVMHTVTAPLHALSVLSVHLIRHPTSRIAGSDISLTRDAGEFAIEKYERIAKDRRLHGIVQLLDNEMLRIVGAAQPRIIMAQPPSAPGITPCSYATDTSPEGRSASAVDIHPPPPAVSQGYGGGVSGAMLGLSAADPVPTQMQMPDVAWSPALADEIGWDWGDFGQLFVEP